MGRSGPLDTPGIHTNRDGERRSRGPHVCGALASNHHPGDARPGSAGSFSCSASRRDDSCRTPCCAPRPRRARLRANRIMSRLSGRDLNRGRRRAMLRSPRGRCVRGRADPQPTRNNGHPTSIERGDMAKPAARGVERHLRDPAPVVADRRQGSPRPDAVGEPRLARHAVRDGPGPHDLTDPARQPDVRDRSSTSSRINWRYARPTAVSAGSLWSRCQ